MAKRILVPLDRTAAAETLVSCVADSARAGATVRLLHVIPVPRDSDLLDLGASSDRLEAAARAYLRALADAHLAGVHVEVAVRFGVPADEILAEAAAFGADLIAVATRTRSSLARGLLGSVAEDLVHRAPTAVMLVRPAA